MIKTVFQKLFGGSGNANFRSIVPTFDLAGWVHRAVFGEVVEITANTTLSPDDSGKTFVVGTDALVVTLPATEAGVLYKFVNVGAAGNNIITVSPAAADGIAGTVTLAATVVVLDGTVNKDAINTKATSKAGDSLTIMGTGETGTTAWVILSSTGIWARET